MFFQKRMRIISACSSVLRAVFVFFFLGGGGLPIKIAGDNCTLSFSFLQPLTNFKAMKSSLLKTKTFQTMMMIQEPVNIFTNVK